MKTIFTFLFLSIICFCNGQTNFIADNWSSLVGYWNFDNSDNFVEAQIGSNLVSQGGFTQVAGLSASDFAVRKTVSFFLAGKRDLKADI